MVGRCVNRVLGQCDLVVSAMCLHLCHLWIVLGICTPCLPPATFTFTVICGIYIVYLVFLFVFSDSLLAGKAVLFLTCLDLVSFSEEVA